MSNKQPGQDNPGFPAALAPALQEIEQGHYLFLIADKRKAIFIILNQDEVEEQKEILHQGAHQKIRTNSGELYGRNAKLTRHIDHQIQEHLRQVAQELNRFISGKEINGLFVGGHQPLFHAIEKELSTDLQKKIRGTFVTELNIPQEQLITHCQRELDTYIKSLIG